MPWSNGFQVIDDIADFHAMLLINRLFKMYQFAVFIDPFKDYPDVDYFKDYQ